MQGDHNNNRHYSNNDSIDHNNSNHSNNTSNSNHNDWH